VPTVAFHGVEVIEIEIQVTIGSGLPAFTVVGLPDKAAAESREVAVFDRRRSAVPLAAVPRPLRLPKRSGRLLHIRARCG
jgi:hypothetical protein